MTSTPPVVQASIEVHEVPEGERKTVTALFADIKGSTQLMEDLDPEEARAIVDPALKLMIEAVHRYDGYVVQSTGDGIFALFGAPVAHEDHPQRALYAALRLQGELKRYSAEVLTDGGTPIQGRIGINTGEVVVRSIQTGSGQIEYTPIGHTTNLACEWRQPPRLVRSRSARLRACCAKAFSSSNRWTRRSKRRVGSSIRVANRFQRANTSWIVAVGFV
jgi:hypothetical protein